MQHSKHTGFNLKRKITASLLSLAILGTGTLPLVSTVVAAAAEDDGSVGANAPVIAVGNTDEAVELLERIPVVIRAAVTGTGLGKSRKPAA